MVRTPRRTFATPFVVTLAACGPAQHTSNPPGPAQPPPSAPVASAPSTDPATPAPPDPCAGMPTEAPSKNPPAPRPPPKGNPPPPETFPYEQRWFVSKSGGACLARPKVDCPKPEAGKPTRTCNPPPPIKYECPKNAPSENFTIV